MYYSMGTVSVAVHGCVLFIAGTYTCACLIITVVGADIESICHIPYCTPQPHVTVDGPCTYAFPICIPRGVVGPLLILTVHGNPARLVTSCNIRATQCVALVRNVTLFCTSFIFPQGVKKLNTTGWCFS